MIKTIEKPFDVLKSDLSNVRKVIKKYKNNVTLVYSDDAKTIDCYNGTDYLGTILCSISIQDFILQDLQRGNRAELKCIQLYMSNK